MSIVQVVSDYFFVSDLHGVTSIFQLWTMVLCHQINCVSWK